MDKQKRNLVLNILGIIVFLIVISYITFRYYSKLSIILRSPESLKEYLRSFGNRSILVFFAMQMIQVIIAAIPGEAIQLAGGYIYGTAYGTLISCSGILAGSIIVFYLSRLLGYRMIKKVLSDKTFSRFDFLMNTNKYEFIMFILFLIPGLPKDILTYFAGITPIHPLQFFVISMAGRFPGIFASSYIGSNLGKGRYIEVVVSSVVVAILIVLSVLYKDKLIDKLKGKKRHL